MHHNAKDRLKVIMDLEKLNTSNAQGCAACGAWAGGPKLVHENEAIFDSETSQYYERSCYKAQCG